MFGFFFCEGPVKSFQDATASDTEKFARWYPRHAPTLTLIP